MTTKLEEAQQSVDAALAKLSDLAGQRDELLRQQASLFEQRDVLQGRLDKDAALERTVIQGQLAAISAALARLGDEQQVAQSFDLAQADARRRLLLGERDSLRSNIKAAEQLLSSGMHDAEIASARQRLTMLELNKAQFVRETVGLYERLQQIAGEEEARELAAKHRRTLA